MGFRLESFQDDGLDGEYLGYLLDQQSPRHTAHYGRLWDYFRNPMTPASGVAAGAMNLNSRPYFQAQEAGLPPRITGVERFGQAGERLTDLQRKEVVIENDIAWRVHTMVDFLFGKPPVIRSLAGDERLARTIEQVVAALLEANGGVSLLQEMALFGAVYGFVDVAFRAPADGPALSPTAQDAPAGPAAPGNATPPSAASPASEPREDRPGTSNPQAASLRRAVDMARRLQLETIEAPRVLPILDECDYRRLRYWVQVFHVQPPRLENAPRPWLGVFRRGGQARPAEVEVVEVLGPAWWQRYEDRQLVAEGPNPLGRLPVIHVQNMALSGSYAGLSDVEGLIPLQDELNTRLSDRAHRVTYQSFKMYLGKGIDDFLERPVGPGQMWATQNLDAHIEEFGTDSGSPSEDAHIDNVRAALDKVSGVTPLAAGLIRGNVGYLTSATALRVLLGGLLARTARKRLCYAAGLAAVVELALEWLHRLGVLRTAGKDRAIEVHWPSVLPQDEGEQLRNAQIKDALGVPRKRILAELGYEGDAADSAE